MHVIENLDAKLMPALGLTRGDLGTSESNWTDWQKSFNGRLFRPDVAPADVRGGGGAAGDGSGSSADPSDGGKCATARSDRGEDEDYQPAV